MNVLDRARIERAVLAYDFWLDLRGTPWRRRRDLRRELRANLRDGAAHSGARAAVGALGSIRQMAADAGFDDPARPRWGVGLWAGAVAFAVCMNLGFFAAFAWLDGARAADTGGAVSGSVTFFPGSSLTYTPRADSFSASYAVGWLPLAVAAGAFLLAARPWRLLRSRRNRILQTST